jgi:hypothetical protein
VLASRTATMSERRVSTSCVGRCYISRLTIQGEEVRALDPVAVLERVDLIRGWDGWDAVDSTYLGRHMRIWHNQRSSP